MSSSDRRSAVLATLALTSVLSEACGDGPTRPSQPSSPLPPPAPAYQIRADVSAPDFTSVFRARVEVVDGPNAGMFCETDLNGLCTLPASFSSAPTPEIRTTKEGFNPLSTRFSSVQSGGDTMYFRLTPTGVPLLVAGTYGLTIRASDTCAAVFPSDARTWSNFATISQNAQDPGGWMSVGILPLGNSPECGFSGGLFGSSLGFIQDVDCGPVGGTTAPPLVLASPGSLLGIGRGRGAIQGSQIVVTFDGDLITPRATCQASDHVFIFGRR